MANAARELNTDELDLISGGDPKTVNIGPLRITAGKGLNGDPVLGISIAGAVGFLAIGGANGAIEGNIGIHSGLVT